LGQKILSSLQLIGSKRFNSAAEYVDFASEEVDRIPKALEVLKLDKVLRETAAKQYYGGKDGSFKGISGRPYADRLYIPMVLEPAKLLANRVIQELALDQVFSIKPNGLNSTIKYEGFTQLAGKFLIKDEKSSDIPNVVYNSPRTRLIFNLQNFHFEQLLKNKPESEKVKMINEYQKSISLKAFGDLVDGEMIHSLIYGHQEVDGTDPKAVTVFTAEEKRDKFLRRLKAYLYGQEQIRGCLREIGRESVLQSSEELLGTLVFLDKRNLSEIECVRVSSLF